MGKLIKEIVKTLTGIMGIRLKTDDVVSTVKKTIEVKTMLLLKQRRQLQVKRKFLKIKQSLIKHIQIIKTEVLSLMLLLHYSYSFKLIY